MVSQPLLHLGVDDDDGARRPSVVACSSTVAIPTGHARANPIGLSLFPIPPDRPSAAGGRYREHPRTIGRDVGDDPGAPGRLGRGLVVAVPIASSLGPWMANRKAPVSSRSETPARPPTGGVGQSRRSMSAPIAVSLSTKCS